MMDTAKVFGYNDQPINIANMEREKKEELRKYCHEMPSDVKMDIALNFREIFPEVSASDTVHMKTADYTDIMKKSSDLMKIFNNEKEPVRFFIPSNWTNDLSTTVYSPSFDTQSLWNGIKLILRKYNNIPLNNVEYTQKILQFMVNYFVAWLRHKEQGMMTYQRMTASDEYKRLMGSPIMLHEIVEEYLKDDPEYKNHPDSQKRRAELEQIFHAMLRVEDDGLGEPIVFKFLDKARAHNIRSTLAPIDIKVSCESVSVMTESTIADNTGQVSIFGSHNFGSMRIEAIKDDLMRLNRNTVAEYLGNKVDESVIRFGISDQNKMFLTEELMASICTATIKRGDEVDMVTIMSYENKAYLLFRKANIDGKIFGISIGEDGSRELIGITSESEFTYKLVGGEEFTMPE